MQLEINHINNRLVEVTADEIESGILNSEDAKKMAVNLIAIANELLQVETK